MARRETKIVKVGLLTQSQRTDLIQIGQRMANVFFNMKSDEKVPIAWREWAKILQTDWDRLRNSGDERR